MAGGDILSLREVYVTDPEETVRLFEDQPPIDAHAEGDRRDMDPSLVLIGDTNVLRRDGPAIPCFPEHGMRDLNNTDAATHLSRQYGEAPFDRAFVAAGRP